MYNMSVLRDRFSNEWCVCVCVWGGGGGGGESALNHLPLLFCKSVICLDATHGFVSPKGYKFYLF